LKNSFIFSKLVMCKIYCQFVFHWHVFSTRYTFSHVYLGKLWDNVEVEFFYRFDELLDAKHGQIKNVLLIYT